MYPCAYYPACFAEKKTEMAFHTCLTLHILRLRLSFFKHTIWGTQPLKKEICSDESKCRKSRCGLPENVIRQLENNLTCRRAKMWVLLYNVGPKMFLCQLKVFSHPSSRDPVRYDGALSLYGASFPIAAYVVVVTRPDTSVLENLGKISARVFWHLLVISCTLPYCIPIFWS